jgi:hypothetical protein
MIAKVAKRIELGPLRALRTARHARVDRGIRLSPAQCAQLCMDCRRRSSSCCHPKLVPLFNESGNLVPTSHRWGHHLAAQCCLAARVGPLGPLPRCATGFSIVASTQLDANVPFERMLEHAVATLWQVSQQRVQLIRSLERFRQ